MEPCPPEFLTYLVILCFEKRSPTQKYCCSPEVKHFSPQKFWAGDAICDWLQYLFILYIQCVADPGVFLGVVNSVEPKKVLTRKIPQILWWRQLLVITQKCLYFLVQENGCFSWSN